ncbi:MAG: hypothetical protein ISS18_15155 [Bacteroidales bacterium]|nr:hypothetical protein [Bacteroidales bacterium]
MKRKPRKVGETWLTKRNIRGKRRLVKVTKKRSGSNYSIKVATKAKYLK